METIEIPETPCNRNCDGCPVQCDVSDEQRKRIMPTIVGGKRPDALAAIERCTDLAALETVETKGILKGESTSWRRAAVAQRIEMLRRELLAENASPVNARPRGPKTGEKPRTPTETEKMELQT